MKERTFLLLIEIMTCFLDSPLVVILIHGLGYNSSLRKIRKGLLKL